MTNESVGALRIEASGYRSLCHVAQDLGSFHVLVGPNASGKSTFLDVVAFLGDFVRVGLEGAVTGAPQFGIPQRASDAKQLTWMRRGSRFELAVEFLVPEELRGSSQDPRPDACRYEVAVDVEGPLRVVAETLWLKPRGRLSGEDSVQRVFFPRDETVNGPIVQKFRKHAPKGWRKIVSRGEEPERVMFCSETTGWQNPFRIGADKAALSSLPEDDRKFPVATWFRRFLAQGVQRIALSSEQMRRPTPPGKSRSYLPDGSNVPLVIHELESGDPTRFERWIRHVQEALPDVQGITTLERPEDRHRYLVVRYRNGLEAPSWLVSDGSLRVLALTLLAYVPDIGGMLLIEEPENGIHPSAIEIVFQSLSSVYGAQVLLATHSPLIVSLCAMPQILCFARSDAGGTDIVAGSEHPRLREWKGSTDPGTLLATGILG